MPDPRGSNPADAHTGEDSLRAIYAAVFSELREALREFERSTPRPGMEARDRLRSAIREARELIRTAQLRTRREWQARGYLRRDRVYLEERDVENLENAEHLLSRIR